MAEAAHYPQRSKTIERFFAWFLARTEGQMDKAYGAAKRRLFADLHGDVLEIGPGTGVNFPYYPRGIRLTGIEPNPFTYPRLHAHAEQTGLHLTLLDGFAEQLPVHDASMDCVVSTLVLCSVFEPEKALAEVLRVLKPGGRFVFIEHVAAKDGSLARGMQTWLRRPWQCCGDGCHLTRETWKTIEAAGFSELRLDFLDVETPFRGLIRRHIAGCAIK